MEKKFVIAYDLGTSGVKIALVDFQGAVIATETADYPLYTPHAGWAEQDPALYWDGICRVTKAAFTQRGMDPAEAAGIALCSQWKGIIPIGKQGQVLRNSIIWLDARASEQAERLNKVFGEGTFSGIDYWAKLMWLRENCPEVYEQADLILEANSYLKWKATGVAAMDVTNSFVHSFDPAMQDFYHKFLEVSGLSAEKFPPTVASTDLVGYVTEEAAAEMGLVPGIPVFGGCGDIPAIAIGSGCSEPGRVHIYFGSSGWVGYSVPHVFNGLYVSPFDETRDVDLFGVQAIGLAFNWTVEKLYGAEWAQMGDGVFPFVDREIAQIPAGAEGVFATPWFYGDRPPLLSEKARGSFLNLGPKSDRRHMTRAVMEGICYTLKMGSLQTRKAKGYPRPAVVHAVGGGAKSAVWMQMLADVMNLPVCVPRAPRHAGAVGTAYCALIGLGVCRDYAEAAARIQIAQRYEPQPEAVAVYEKGFAMFERLYPMLEPLFSGVNGD